MANPLATSRKPQAPHPAEMHAKMWQHVNTMQSDEMTAQIQQSSYATPILGALAADPKVTRKDVIKAAADAAADGKIPPSQAVSFITQMPDDPDKLRPWLKGLYAANMSALVHMKAAQMPAPAPVQAPAPAQTQPAPQMPQGAPTQ